MIFTEKNLPLLCIDNLDPLLMKDTLDYEELFQVRLVSFLFLKEPEQKLAKTVQRFNRTLEQLKDKDLEMEIDPSKGRLVFGSSGWAFSLATFAAMYSNKWGVDEAKLVQRLWGDS